MVSKLIYSSVEEEYPFLIGTSGDVQLWALQPPLRQTPELGPLVNILRADGTWAVEQEKDLVTLHDVLKFDDDWQFSDNPDMPR